MSSNRRLEKLSATQRRKYDNVARASGDKAAREWLNAHATVHERNEGSTAAVRRAFASPPALQLSGAAHGYAATLADPFNVHGVGLPLPPVVDSRKSTAWIRGSVAVTGTSGIGAISFRPWQAIINNGVGAVTYSSSSTLWAGTVLPAVGNTGTTSSQSNSVFTAAQLQPGGGTPGIQVRLISAGLRWQYIGTKLNAGGRYFALSEPDNQNLEGMDSNDLRAYTESTEERVLDDGKWRSVVWAPVHPWDFNYTDNLGSNTEYAGGFEYAMLGLLFTSPDTGTIVNQVMFDCFVNFEVVGNLAAGGSKTPNSEDAAGATKVLDAIQTYKMRMPTTHPTASHDGGRFLKVIKGVVEAATQATQLFPNIAAAKNILTSPQTVFNIANLPVPSTLLPQLADVEEIAAEAAPLLLTL